MSNAELRNVKHFLFLLILIILRLHKTFQIPIHHIIHNIKNSQSRENITNPSSSQQLNNIFFIETILILNSLDQSAFSLLQNTHSEYRFSLVWVFGSKGTKEKEKKVDTIYAPKMTNLIGPLVCLSV